MFEAAVTRTSFDISSLMAGSHSSSQRILASPKEKSRLYHTKLLAEHVAASIPGTQAGHGKIDAKNTSVRPV